MIDGCNYDDIVVKIAQTLLLSIECAKWDDHYLDQKIFLQVLFRIQTTDMGHPNGLGRGAGLMRFN